MIPKELLNQIKKNKEPIKKVLTGTVVIISALYTTFKTNRKIKSRKLNHKEAIEEYQKIIKKIEHELANEYLGELKRKKLEKEKTKLEKKLEKLIKEENNVNKEDNNMDKKAIEFIPNNTKVNGKSYQYGFFYEEKETGYYINKKTIDNIISKINWSLADIEVAYINTWKELELTHMYYVKNIIDEDTYNKKIEKLINKFAEENDLQFGEGVDELTNFLIRNLIG